MALVQSVPLHAIVITLQNSMRHIRPILIVFEPTLKSESHSLLVWHRDFSNLSKEYNDIRIQDVHHVIRVTLNYGVGIGW